MTRSLIARRGFGALLAGLTVLLVSCGGDGGSGSGNSNLRVLNATSDLTSIDVYLGTSKTFSADAVDTITSTSTVPAGAYDVKVTTAGNTTTLFTGAYSLTNDLHYTGVVWGRNGSLHFATLPEDENTDNIGTGNSRIRVYNATTDSGSLDVYLTQNIDDLANATVTASATASAALSGYKELSAGTYRLRVTTAGDNTDVRLDVPAVTLTSKQYSTLIVTAGPSGVLVHSALVVQQGSLTQYKNTQSRIRVVAGAEARGSVSVLLDGVTLAGSLRSPTVGPYVLVNSGSRAIDVRLNSVSISTATQTLAPAADYTLLAYGSDGAGLVSLFTDDNRLPATGRYRIRLINGAVNTDPLTLSIDFAALISDIPAGSASSFVTGAVNSSAQIDVTSTSGIDSLYTAADVNLQTLGVYTVFMLGGQTAPTGVLRKDR